MLSNEQILTMLAEAYHAAALSGADMRAATESMEAIRAALSSGSDPISAWDAIDEQVGRALTFRHLPALLQLRDRFETAFAAGEIARLEEAFQRDAATGWRAWQRSFVEALTKGRPGFTLKLCDAPLPIPADADPPASEFRRMARLVLHERWAEAYELFTKLAECQFIPPLMRVKLLVAASNICLYYFLQPHKANDLLERAERLDAQSAEALAGRGSYWLERPDLVRAAACFERAVAADPRSPDGYVGLGECHERCDDLQAAELQYREAIKNASGSISGYTYLITLYGRPSFFVQHKADIAALVKTIITVEPKAEYTAYCFAGRAHAQNEEAEAHRWYQKAISKEPDRIGAYLAEGYLYLENEDLDRAEQNFRLVIQVAPEAMDGYWGMSWVSEEREDWQATIHWCEEIPLRRPQWTGSVCARIGRMERNLGRIEEAETLFTKVLESEPENQEALDGLCDLANDYSKKRNDSAHALRLLENWRQRKGEAAAGEYQNLAGNVKCYHADYLGAAEHYRKAVALDPAKAVYHANLAFALERREEPGSRAAELDEALDALRSAIKLGSETDREDYQHRLDELENERRFLLRYGEPALRLKPMIKPIRLAVHQNLVPVISTESRDSLSLEMAALIGAVRGRIRQRFGVLMPNISVEDITDSTASPGEYHIELMERITVTSQVVHGRRFAVGLPAQFQALKIKGRTAVRGELEVEGLWIAKSHWEKAAANGLEMWTEAEVMLRHLERIVEQNLAEMVYHQATVILLSDCGADAATSIRGSAEKTVLLTQALKRLLKAGKPIFALDRICGRFEQLFNSGADASAIADQMIGMPELYER